jgi:uridine kinase
MNQNIILSICGASGSGKSSLAKAVTQIHPDCERVPTDYFIIPTNGDLKGYFKEPIEYDWGLLDKTIDTRIGEIVTTPTFDFTTFQRHAVESGRPFRVKQVLVTDGFYPHPRAALKVLLRCDDALRMHRIVERDRAWNTDVAGRWAHLEKCRERLERDHPTWDLVLSGTEPLSENARRVVAEIYKTIAIP